VRDLGIQHRHYGTDFSVLDAELGVGGWLVSIAGAEDTYEDIFLPLHGRYQVMNLANAVAATEALLGRKLDPEALRDATAVAAIPGRMEPLASSPLVMVDGAHNADGVTTLVESLEEEFPTTSWHVVFGVMGDKNIPAMLDRLQPVTTRIYATAAKSERAVDPSELAEMVARAGIDVVKAPDPEVALDMATADAGPDGAVLVTGSLYLAGEVRDVLVP
jgi:dihydrofolate synthase/folylpolyglutamate synthase